MALELCRSRRVCPSWYFLGFVVLPASLTDTPVKAQEIYSSQPPVSVISLKENRAQLVAQNPLPREIQPPSTQPQPQSPTPRLPPPANLLQPSTPNSGVSEPPLSGPTPSKITVERFEVTGSTVFSPADFAQVTKPFTQRSISLAELFQVRDAVTRLYLDRGYVTSGAYIPPQRLKRGVVEIKVVEGKLEDIKVTGTRRLNPAYVRSRIGIATGQPLNRNRLLEALQLLQLDPRIQNLSADLSAGTRPGQSLLSVKVIEAKSFSAQLTLDNRRSPTVGTDRRQIQLNQSNLLGLGDELRISYTNTKGSNAGDLSYTLPVNPRNGTVSFNFGISSSYVTEPPFNALDINSDSRFYELTFRQPIVQTPTQELALGITATRQESKATLLNGEIPFPALGADNKGETRLTALRFFQAWTQRSSRSVFAARSQFSIGLNALNSTINNTAPDSRFFSWRGQAQWVRLLGPDTPLLLRTDLQLADRALLPFEQFALGGQDSVRGYRQDALLTDNGIFASAEVRVPILRRERSDLLLQLAPFVDFGKAWNRSGGSNPDPSTLASVGLGLRLQVGKQLSARFDWGIPLISTSGSKRTWQENGLYFSLTYDLF